MWFALNRLNEIARAEGNYTLAKTYHTEALALAREIESKRFLAASLGNLGFVALHEGNLKQASELFAQSPAQAQEKDQKA